jgi:SAM-dependent methyltransferase
MAGLLLRHRIAAVLANSIKNVKGGQCGRLRFWLTYFVYIFLPFLGYDYHKLIEWSFILRGLNRSKRIKSLDVGCTSNLFIYQLASYGEAFGIDARPYYENLPKNIEFIQADVSHMPFPDNSFDVITLISVIEHIGLGGYGDPVYGNGDFEAMAELKRALKKDGKLFITTLIGNKYIVTPDGSERIYDKSRLAKLVENFVVRREEYYIFRKKWILTDKHTAFLESPERFALACLELVSK